MRGMLVDQISAIVDFVDEIGAEQFAFKDQITRFDPLLYPFHRLLHLLSLAQETLIFGKHVLFFLLRNGSANFKPRRLRVKKPRFGTFSAYRRDVERQFPFRLRVRHSQSLFFLDRRQHLRLRQRLLGGGFSLGFFRKRFQRAGLAVEYRRTDRV